MTKQRFLKFLDYPNEWEVLYSDELFEIQLSAMTEELGNIEAERRFTLEKYGSGSEHYRYGAFHWALRNICANEYGLLIFAIEKEPDIELRNTMLKDLSAWNVTSKY